ncbi:putative endonuclease [Clostridium algifaecis]|uniref:Endonuclease n=1 Tax=Clostridium algifaecis TaxID=1472040 RepID=A0ABS4KQN7_9CLOT|nr:GIY-YIG nuclease family protein [Clostridium algifaecis]MBP2032344.1 putative endonuclease [Clostridium algifaecis]
MHYVYILRCNDNTFYTGYTNNLNKRIQTHNAGKGAKYTRGRLPVKLVYFEEYSSKIQAMQREYAIKQLTKENKLKIIQSNKNLK